MGGYKAGGTLGFQGEGKTAVSLIEHVDRLSRNSPPLRMYPATALG